MDNLSKLRNILTEDPFNLDPSSLELEKAFEDLPDWDSMKHLTFLMELEKNFDITIDSQLMRKITSVRSVLDILPV